MKLLLRREEVKNKKVLLSDESRLYTITLFLKKEG